jgi:hypothetical protein
MEAFAPKNFYTAPVLACRRINPPYPPFNRRFVAIDGPISADLRFICLMIAA